MIYYDHNITRQHYTQSIHNLHLAGKMVSLGLEYQYVRIFINYFLLVTSTNEYNSVLEWAWLDRQQACNTARIFCSAVQAAEILD